MRATLRFTLSTFCILALPGLATVPSALAQGPDKASGEFGKRGRLVERSIDVDGRNRTYRLFAPRRPSNQLPLVFVLHGGGAGERAARQIIDYTQFRRIAIKEKFIVVWPVGYEGNWNDGRGVEFIPAQQQKIDDVKFVRSIVDDIQTNYEIDRSRVFATGISNGAMMAHRLAADASDLIAAIAPVAGGMPQPLVDSFQPEHPVSILIINGNADPLVPLDGGNVGRDRRPRGQVASTSDCVQLYLRANGIDGPADMKQLPDNAPDDGTTTSASRFPVGKDGSRVWLFVVDQGGHTWPGKRQYLDERIIGKTGRDFDGSEVIWEFFKSAAPRKIRANNGQ